MNPLAYRKPGMHPEVHVPDPAANSLLFACYLKGRRDRDEGKPAPEPMPTWTPDEREQCFLGFEAAAREN